MSVSSKFSRSHTKFHTKRVQHCLVTPRFACSMTILSGWMMNESPQALEVGKMKWMWSSKTWHQKIWKAALCNVYISYIHFKMYVYIILLLFFKLQTVKLSDPCNSRYVRWTLSMQRLRTRRPESKGALDDNVQHLQQMMLRCYQSPELVRSISNVTIILDTRFFEEKSTVQMKDLVVQGW